jgi:serine protease AprX
MVGLLSVLFAAFSSRVPAQTPGGSANRSNAPFDTTSLPGKLDAMLRWQTHGPGERVRVIVTKERGHALDSVAQAIRALRGDVRQTLPNVSAVVADLPADTLLPLTSSPSVRAVSLDAPLQPVDGNVVRPPAAPIGGETLRDVLGLPPINPAAGGIGVAVIDSGLSPNADFATRITAFYDFTAGGVASSPLDPYGHGTHVAGIIASSGADSSHTQYRGVAAEARLIGLRVLDGQGMGQTSLVLQAIDFAIAQREALGIDVINLSLGHPIYEPAETDPLVGAVEAAIRSGIVVVVSGGNFGYNRVTGQAGYAGITSPGNAPSAITVGALQTANTTTRDDDRVAPYSSRGPSWYDATAKPDLVAPGDGIISNATPDSTLYQMYPSVRVDAWHMSLNGTSMAAAVTSGVAALVIEANRQTHPHAPPLTPSAIKAILQVSATPVGVASAAPPDALIQGAGAINVPAAIDLAHAIDPAYPPVIPESDLVWGSSIPWYTNIVWGIDLIGSCSGGQSVASSSSDDCPNGQTFTPGPTGDPSTTFWGSLATVITSGQTFTWGSTDPPAGSHP